MNQEKGNLLALLPLLIFVALFLGAGIISGDFYSFPVLVAIIIAAVVALAMNRKDSLNVKVERFAKGAGNLDIMIMVLIFLSAGAFSGVAEKMGAVDSTVNFALSVIPENLLIVGLFVIAAFISLAMGTSMGTIAALAPIGVGISSGTDISLPLAMATVVGGSMFGDNLSFISDTTIAAVRTQKTEMKDKFKVNFFIVLPAAIITIIALFFVTLGNQSSVDAGSYSIVKILPYLAVIIGALSGLNVFAVLFGGILLSGIIGFIDGSFTPTSYFGSIADGMLGMGEIAFLSILIGGVVELIRHNGGIQALLYLVTRKIGSSKGAQYSTAGLVASTNLCTANNTISIIIAGPLAKSISDEYGVDNRKTASILDIFSCAVQGLIPYGAQMLLVAETAGISPLSILPYAFYPILTAICGLVAIKFALPRFTRRKAHSTEPVRS
ncbi:Na+/H+ antiporter NhaC family protein [Rossellomorea marisflavi]|uniref:Sodium:proton antiporter n=1 Tax=Rossellomorea marisflavi TaxID=189381 RepID=A0A0J5V8I6_9BACI|nr:Na+/H+ antiporter NhaC family protein [Rossellomorea marisflavi]KMK91598.1 sodium:proton antiporter [Rossellomorea marisflavi]KML33534.1 sodium:proton antiporter [Rossellomorea marisflavi]KZE50130.1 sodium:proton antiporter [Rossellomorea marisflavi]MCM2605938.1 Na+/H+ antiporter NhaC family protein [Rossellomorea marisflavi]QHA34617.1 Na+/H+ antiporter NhaC family protein [Rossellomorea marisflavi]